MELVEMALQRINGEVVMLIERHGGHAVGLSGKDGGLMLSRKMRMTLPDSEGNPSEVDIGLVGEVVAINPGVLNALEGASYIPVIAPVGYDHEGNTYNINADLAAGKIAAALKAEKLILMTDVAGIRDEHGKLVSTLDVAHAKQMIEQRHYFRGDDSQSRMLHRRAARGRGQNPYHRWPRAAFAAARRPLPVPVSGLKCYVVQG